MNRFCECADDGFCPRYNRQMGGRMRELCAGINVDLGTAAAFREQWRRETGRVMATPGNSGTDGPMPLLLKTDQAPGDAVVMTAAIYSLHRAHPGKYLTAVESNYSEVFEHNPDVVPIESIPDAVPLHMHYPAIHESNHRGIHFMQGWCEFLGSALGINVPLMTNRPQLYFNDYTEKPPTTQKFWLVCSGGKSDFTNKLWHRYQEVVSYLKGYVIFIQVGEFPSDHPPLNDILAYDVGKTTLRGLFEMVRHCRGVLCGVSLLMHVAAALEKPCVVIAGGREPVQWNAYPLQHYLHTVGQLRCSDITGYVGGACWRSRVVPLGDGTVLDKDTCERPVNGVPQCMSMITPEEVAGLILRCNSVYDR